MPQPQVAEPDLLKRAQLLGDLGHFSEEFQSFLDRKIQRLVNVLATIADFQHLRFVASAFAFFAYQLYVREELHFDGYGAIPLTGLASSTRNVEGKVSCGEAAFFCLGLGSVQVTNPVEGLGVGHRIGAGRAADGRLIDQYDFIQILVALYAIPALCRRLGAVGLFLRHAQSLIKHVMQQGGLAGPGHARNGN